ncbi:hypothetical protein J25TS5_03200 [Paenibacillus faecis]|uniref:GerMN domain-containing protein n=1 Tax=Paenibacillus faecis TaxID=862114 RepID=UPI001AFD0977|nr:GerMN domain-containing protein [Paenibacillus faecis]GIO83388.1 hypothetical protein J25TS5_03200 [Paenibacillus faecis]
MNRKRWTLGMIVLLLAWSTGCGQKPQAASDVKPGTETRQPVTDTAPPVAAESPEQQPEEPAKEPAKVNASGQQQAEQVVKQQIETYYTDDQMLELKTATVEIAYEKEKDKYLAALQTLKSSGQSAMFALWEKAEFRSANLKDGVLTVDIHLPDEARLGAGGEALALEALERTVFQFKEIQAVDLLVDGDPAETLMGHEELEHPIPRN